MTRVQPRLISIYLLLIFFSACGGGGGGGKSSPAESESFSLNEQNGNVAMRRMIDASGAILKIAIQLQESLDKLINSEENNVSLNCRTSGSIEVSTNVKSEIHVDFNQCNNEQLGEIFDGEIFVSPDYAYYNTAEETYFIGTITIPNDLGLSGLGFSSVSGAFDIRQQSTWHGDTLLVSQKPENTLTLKNDKGEVTVQNYSANLEYDLDEAHNLYPTSSFYGKFSLELTSSELNGEYSCSTKEEFDVQKFLPRNFEINCSDETQDTFRLQGGQGPEISVAKLDPKTNTYSEFLGISWGYFKPLFVYQPGFPQPTVDAPEIPSKHFDFAIVDGIHSSYTQHLYLATPQSGSQTTYQLVEVQIDSGKVLRELPLTGNPNSLAISKDGHALYIGYSDIPVVHKIDVLTLSISATLQLGEGSQNSLNIYARKIAVSPTDSNLVAVATIEMEPHPTSGGRGLTLFKNESLIDSLDYSDPTRLTFSGDGNHLYTYTDDSTVYNIEVFEVNEFKLRQIHDWHYYTSLRSDLVVDSDNLYMGDGAVINPLTGSLLASNLMLFGINYEDEDKLTALQSPDGKSVYMYGNRFVEIFDKNRHKYKGFFDPKIPEPFLRLININDDQFAFITKTGVTLFRHEDVPFSESYECEPDYYSDLRSEIPIIALPCPFNDAVYSKTKDKILAAMPGHARSKGNTVAIINSETLAIEEHIEVGDEPIDLEISKNERYLFVSYNDASLFSIIDLSTNEIIKNVELPLLSLEGPIITADLEPFPSDESSVVVALKRRHLYPEYIGMSIFTDGEIVTTLEKEAGTHSANQICFSNDSTLYGFDNDVLTHTLVEFSINSNSISYKNEYFDILLGIGNNDLLCSENRVYSSQGYVFDTITKTLAGSMSDLSTDYATHHQFSVDESKRLMYLYGSTLYASNDPALKIFNIDSFEELRSIKMPTYGLLLSDSRAVLDIGENRLLIALEGIMYLIDKRDIVL